MKTLRDVDIAGKRVFLRVDFNVPLDEAGKVTDDTRIQGVLPTLQFALDQKAKIIIASHLGRPKGRPVAEFSLKPAAQALEAILGQPVAMAGDSIGEEVSARVGAMKPGDLLMLENLRFHPEEEKNDDTFAKALAALCDVYVNDAFAVSHRENASVHAITRHAPISVAGFLMDKEITYFNQAMKNPKRPLAAVVGGAKVSTKLAALENMINQVDKILIGGAMANTFLKSLGTDVGKSKIEEDLVETARTVMAKAAEKKVRIYLPVDAVVADRLAPDAASRVVPVQDIPADQMALDIGPATSLLFREALCDAKSIVWNGPMGAFETEAFARGTLEMVNTLTESGALTIVGGGDTDTAVHQSGKADRISYISTGGGAFLELLEGKALPGITALEDADR